MIGDAIVARGSTMVELAPSCIDEISGVIADACEAGMTRLVIAGGDGLIHHALPALACAEGVTVGIVPVGTGNDFARGLGLPTKVEPATEVALAAATSPVDLISVGPDDGWAASVVTGGFSGQVNARANRLRFPPGQQRYTVATLLELHQLQTVDLRLDIDGEPHELTSSLFAIANSRYFGGGMAICPDALPTDGLLDVTVIGPTSRFELARMLPTVFSGRHVDHRAVTTYRAKQVEVVTDVDLWADGEPLAGRTFTAAHGALQVAGSVMGT
jgi:diacylglycerol kinase (ATP)